VKIVALSDTHRRLTDIEVPECDILIHAGDEDITDLKSLMVLNNWFKNQKAELKILVPGNHDFLLEKNLSLARTMLTEVKVLIDETIEFKGIKIHGSPCTPTFGFWAFMKDRGDEIQKHWDMIPEDTNILITHGPAYGYLDQVEHCGSVGCENLLQTVIKIKPDFHIFGHLHLDGYKQIKKEWENSYKTTTFCNVAMVNEDYDLVNPPTTVYLKEDTDA
jgi:Icc-related predicted phosphoesterase